MNSEQREAKRKSRKEMKRLYEDFFGSAVGQVILKDICEQFKVGTNVFNPDSERVNAYNQGQQNAGIWIKKQSEK